MANILIVDDEVALRNLLRDILTAKGYSCTAAANAAEARHYLKENDFELILSDIDMPGESGLDFMRYALAEYPDTAGIVVSVVDNQTTEKIALEIGIFDYIFKPFNRNTILFSVANAMRRRELEIENRAYKEQLESLVELRTETLQKTINRLETAQLALKDSELKYRQLVENSNSIIIKLDIEGRVIFFNKFAQRFFGYTEDEILGQNTVGTIVSEKDSSGRDLREMIQDIIKNPDKYRNNENENTRRDGDRVWVAWANKAIFDMDGNVTEILCIGHNITDRIRAKQALLESEEKFRTISASAQDAIIMMDSEGKISYWNAAAEKVFGYQAREALNHDLHMLIVPEHYHEAFQNNFPKFHKTGQGAVVGKTTELTARRKNGNEFPVELSLSAMTLKGKWQALGIIRDISERRIIEAQLVQAQKLESIGQLAAGIAHEINTPMQYVAYNTRFLQEQFEQLVPLLDKYQELLQAAKAGSVSDDFLTQIESAVEEVDLDFIREEIPPAIDQTLEGAERVAEIVRAMKEFSHPGTEEKTPIDINKAIESTVTVARNEWKYVAEVATDLDANLPLVPCLPGDFNQVILNMLVNAAHAIGDVIGDGSDTKGTITIRTSHNDGRAEIRIQDTGTGIAEEHRSRIFDPFYTTKEVGKGTGQGLAISHSVIVDKHGGSINLETEKGQGATFIIQLPIPEASV